MTNSKDENYQLLVKQATALMKDEPDWLAKLANLSSLLFYGLPHVNFAGFYRYQNKELVLGPFQGKIACAHIPLGRGVCGQAAASRKIKIVSDVHHFTGYIACDSAAKSEIVLPIFQKQNLWGVLDIEADRYNNFEQTDAKYLAKIGAAIFGSAS